MSLLKPTSSTLLRTCTRRQCVAAAARTSTAAFQLQQQQQQRRLRSSDLGATTAGDQLWRGSDDLPSTKVPDWGSYKSSSGVDTNKVFQYFMVGTMGALAGMGAKTTVQDFLVSMSASADVLAMAKVEVDLATIPEGKNVIVKWRGKPVFIRHRTADEIEEARNEKWETLRDPQSDEDRVKKPEWLVMVGVCTHLGCVPIGEAGDYGGWFCPCHGSHYDISGRARKGPAPLNLAIPEYDFASDTSLVIG
ncbi:MAG: hsp70 nucleotide exchange factor fes1 [Peltula sp. TS41687]|nr:MAG: hsp70 nucleotide exchange factor fes1 [Peltula sp. TS41687]